MASTSGGSSRVSCDPGRRPERKRDRRPRVRVGQRVQPNLQFTSPGVLAMANSGQNTNGSQFFITDEAYRGGDFTYTIFGFMTEGASILNAIENVPVHAQSSTNTEVSAPNNTVTMTSVTISTDTQNGVLQLSAPNGTTGTATVNVTAADSVTGATSTQSFTVTVGADTDHRSAVPQPARYRHSGDPNHGEHVAVSFTIPGLDVNGNAINYTATVPSADAGDLTVSSTARPAWGRSRRSTGPAAFSALRRQSAHRVLHPTPSDTEPVPVYVAPAAPSGLQLLSGSNDLTDLNNSTGKPLQFQVNGVVSGATVQLSIGGTVIPTTETQTGTTVVLTTTPSGTGLADGSHSVTATQVLDETNVAVGNTTVSPSLTSVASSPLTMTIDTTPPAFNFTPNTAAFVGVPYTCQVTTSADSAGAVTYQLTSPPAGMTINAATGLITWTPTATQVTSGAPVIVVATDPAGNTATKQFTVKVVSPAAPVLTAASPSLGTTDAKTPETVPLTNFINGAAGTTTQITVSNPNAVAGGIAVTAVTGDGTWAFSLDGTTFTNFTSVGTVADDSALLLPKTAFLRYTPDGTAETASITYRAWDATSGTPGTEVDTTDNGGTTAFSTAPDTASLTVLSTQDNVVLTTAHPSLGSTTASSSTPSPSI